MHCFRAVRKGNPCHQQQPTKKSQNYHPALFSFTAHLHQHHNPASTTNVRCRDSSSFRLPTNLTFAWHSRYSDRASSASSFRSFSSAKASGTTLDSGDDDNDKPVIQAQHENPASGIETVGDFDSPYLGPCYSQLAVTPTPRGYAFEILLRPRQHQEQQQQQQRQYSSSGGSSSGSGTATVGLDQATAAAAAAAATAATPDGTTSTGIDAKTHKRRRQRLQVYYPYNNQDIRRKQHMRKEKARKRTIANVNRALLGNVVIAGSKLAAWFCSQSSSMMSEFIHSCVDCANQYLLLKGLRDSSKAPDRKHPYGYGKSVYFWALVSALGTFFMGFGISMSHAWGELMNPSLHDIGPEVLGVLMLSFAIDGYVLTKTLREVREEIPEGVTLWAHIQTMRDPAILAILLEDGAACFGVLMAIAGTTASHYTGMPIYDGLAGVGISILLGTMGFTLARMNYRFLLGQAVDKDMTDKIENILKSRRSIDTVASVQSQWTGPDTFSYKAEVGFDGTFLAAKLMPTHEKEFFAIRGSMEKDLSLVLSWYAEDVIRTVEREVRILEAQIRQKYPAAEYIELEPMSKDSHEFAIDDSFEKDLVRIETETLESFRKLMPKLEQHEGGGPSGAPLTSPDILGEKGPSTSKK